jgi:hypothetical protein
VSSLLLAIVYVSLQNFLNVLVQIENKMGLEKISRVFVATITSSPNRFLARTGRIKLETHIDGMDL